MTIRGALLPADGTGTGACFRQKWRGSKELSGKLKDICWERNQKERIMAQIHVCALSIAGLLLICILLLSGSVCRRDAVDFR